MSARKRKLIFKQYSFGRGRHWRFRRAVISDLESSILFGADFDKLKTVTRTIAMSGLHGFYYGRH